MGGFLTGHSTEMTMVSDGPVNYGLFLIPNLLKVSSPSYGMASKLRKFPNNHSQYQPHYLIILRLIYKLSLSMLPWSLSGIIESQQENRQM